MTTLISHIYNEEFLLPFFIDHHYGKFDQGIILDYGSTDNSLSILKTMAPKWTIVDCSEQMFDAVKLDALVHLIEEDIEGVCLALTVTEFFIGDPRFVTEGMVLPSYSLLRTINDPEIKQGQKFHEIYKFGISPFLTSYTGDTEWLIRLKGRKIKSSKEKYPLGRHYEILGQSPFLIYRVANCLASKEMVERRLQIQERIPLEDKKLGYGVQHTNYGKGLDFNSLTQTVEVELAMSEDISPVIANALDLELRLRKIETDSPEYKLAKNLISLEESNQVIFAELSNRKKKLEQELLDVRNELQRTVKITENQLEEKQREISAIANVNVRQLEELRSKVDVFEIQSKRPSYNLKKFMTTILPAVKVRLRQLFR